MENERLKGDFNKKILLLKGIRNEEKCIEDAKNETLYFTNAEVFRKMGRESKEDLFGDALEGYYVRPYKEKNNFLNIKKGQKDAFDKQYLAKIYTEMKEVYISSFFYITIEEFENNKIPESIINVFRNEFSDRKIAVFYGVQNLLDGLEREQGTNGDSWANYVHYQGIDEKPIFEEEEYDKDPRLGYLLKRKGLYENQREFRICFHKNCFTDKFIEANKNGFNLSYGRIGEEKIPSITILDDINDLKYLSIGEKK
ncbi:hypothetical protein COK91_25705 [Bacillus cereus]|uniref:hypothetical protein n=1 Tax=Bacillus cereus group TaxID=86661 RepID=UPI000A3BA9C6|nr:MULTISPECIES: hypothetical protein [Bacillus cereus group]OUA56119.1 hypothetical protein BK781_19835 [Bacillus thuringiensis serovar aizawai]PEW06099.1 hypothetical protein CN440_26780 [Bacillus cereus]PFU78646.1 hypothetical protein COK91_25705 [Bacillus cereus]